jgi:hypothetical protein
VHKVVYADDVLIAVPTQAAVEHSKENMLGRIGECDMGRAG